MNPFDLIDPREIRRQAMLAAMRKPEANMTVSNEMTLKQLGDDVWRVTCPSGPRGTMQSFKGSLQEATSAAAKALAERAMVTGFHAHGDGSGIPYGPDGKVIAPAPVVPEPAPALVVQPEPEPDRPLNRPLDFQQRMGSAGAGLGGGIENPFTPGAGR